MALPGVRTVLKDRFYILSRTDIPTGPRVCILGVRDTVDGTSDGSVAIPDLDPYLATNEQKVINAFGQGSALHKAYVEAVAGGALQIYLVALPNTTTDGDLVSTANGNVLDLAMEAAETILPDIIVPWGRGGHPTEYSDPAATLSSPAFGFYADNSTSTSTSLAARVSDWCATITDRSHPVFAVMGIKPFLPASEFAGESLTATNLATHTALSNLVNKDSIDSGQFLSVVAAEIRPLGYEPDWGYSNGAALYAGFVSQLRSWSASTGKLVFNATGIRYNPTRSQQASMSGKGVVPVALDFSRRATYVDGITFAAEGSDYSRLTTLRIVFDAVQLIRQVSQGFIGEAATLQHRNAFETAITAGLRGMQQAGALLDSGFVVSYIASENKAVVDLVLQPAFELRNIEIQVAVNL